MRHVSPRARSATKRRQGGKTRRWRQERANLPAARDSDLPFPLPSLGRHPLPCQLLPRLFAYLSPMHTHQAAAARRRNSTVDHVLATPNPPRPHRAGQQSCSQGARTASSRLPSTLSLKAAWSSAALMHVMPRPSTTTTSSSSSPQATRTFL